MALHERRHALGAVHLEAGDVLAPQRGAHVDEADRLVGARAAQRLEQLHAGRARAVDQHVAGLLAHAHGQLDADAPEQPARHLARPPDEGRAEDRIEDDDGAGHDQDAGRASARRTPGRPREARAGPKPGPKGRPRPGCSTAP